MSQITEFTTDWNNINLENGIERNYNILENISFEKLLTEITCNLPIINEETVNAHFMKELELKMKCAKDIFKSNLTNIVKRAIKEQSEY